MGWGLLWRTETLSFTCGWPEDLLVSLESILSISRLAPLNAISFLSTRSQLMLPLLKSLLPGRTGNGILSISG
mgnify:CR=1 FL=1|jgi:hypothetical protein